MNAREMFKSVFTESCTEYLARFYLNKYQIHTIGKMWDTVFTKLMSREVRMEYNKEGSK